MRVYNSDVTDGQWEMLLPHLVKKKRRGPKSRQDLRRVVNAIFYRLRTGCQWRMLPKEYGHWEPVYGYWYRWSKSGLWEKINTTLREVLREKAGRKRQPTAAVIDSQSVKTAQKRGQIGYDAGKLTKGRKRHIAVDTLGLLLCVIIHSAGVQDRDGAMMLISRLSHRFSLLKHIWADGAYAGELVTWVYNVLGWTLEVVKRSDTLKQFIVLPRRWVVERTFAWLCNYRLNAKDYSHSTKCSEAAIYAASVNLMLRRIYPK